jgi:hypothetical protein
MVVSNDRGQLIVAQARDHVGALISMGLDLVELRGGESPRRVEKRLRHAELADVVKERGPPDPCHIFTAEPDPPAEHRRVSRHAPRMPVEIRILGLERAGQLAQQLRSRRDGHASAIRLIH